MPKGLENSSPAKENVEQTYVPKIENEWGKLRTVLMAKTPRPVRWFNHWAENPVHAYWIKEAKISGTYQPVETSEVFADQHKALIRFLEKQGVRVIQEAVDTGTSTYDYMFPRDSAAVIGDSAITSRFANAHRQVETDAILRRIKDEKIRGSFENYALEGGDVAVYSPELVFVGIGPRTNKKGLEVLRSIYPHTDFHPVYTTNPKMAYHLDTILTFVDKNLALVMEDLIDDTTKSRLASLKVDRVPAEEGEWMYCPTNVLALDRATVISSTMTPMTNRNLTYAGVKVLELDQTESVKQGGSFHCMTLPLERVGHTRYY